MRLAMCSSAPALLALAVLAGGAAACGGSRGDVLVRDGVAQAERGEADEARRTFRKALVATPGVAGARTGLAALTKDRKEALELLDGELESHPELWAARFDRALLLLASGLPADATRAADDLARLPENDLEARRLLAIARYMGGATEDVPPELAGLATSSPEALAQWASVRDGLPDALVSDAVLALSPRLHAAYLAHRGQWEDALAKLPVAPETTVDRAIALAWLDRIAEARALVAEALRNDPNDARAHALSDVLAAQGD